MRKLCKKFFTMVLFAVALLLCLPMGAKAQEQLHKIRGLITDETGNPVSGAVIAEKDGTRGTTSNNDGMYQMDVPAGTVLLFQFIGFATEERTVGNNSDQLNVRMAQQVSEIDDVVVIAYGTQKKSSAVASMSTIAGDQIPIKQRNLRNSLAGQIPGVIAVQRSGEPGNDAAAFYIRGQSSYAGGTSPLVLVDGVPRSMDDIDVDEIESFTVLKDAAATAVLGAEGANGVVLITSKRGRQQKTQINFSAQKSLMQLTRMPNSANAVDFLTLYNEKEWNREGNPDKNYFLPVYKEDLLQKYRDRVDPDLYPSVNWHNLLSNLSQSQRYTINFRGGSEKARFFVAGSYFNEDGIYKSTTSEGYDANINLDRFNLRSNVDLDVTRSTRLSVDLSGQYMKKRSPGTSADAIFSQLLHSPTHLFPMYYSDGTAAEYLNAGWEGKAQPYNSLNNSGYRKEWYTMLQSKVTLNQQLDFITRGLSIRGLVSFDSDFNGGMRRSKKPTAYWATGRDADGNLIKITSTEGTPLGDPIRVDGNKSNRIYMEAALNYQRIFNAKHDVTAMALFMQKENSVDNPEGAGIFLLPYRKQSFVARGNYIYDNRYMLEVSLGMTGSENFAKGYRWGVFPATGVAWSISNENFMKSARNVVNNLKLRASIGVTGNDNVRTGGQESRFPYMGTLNTDLPGVPFGIIPGVSGGAANYPGAGIADGEFGSPLLRWEKERKINVGVDLGLFNGSVELVMDYFTNRRTDILVRRETIPGATGFRTFPYQNYGITTNQGLDASIALMHRFGEVTLTGRGTFTFSRNKVVERDEIPKRYSWMNSTGRSIGQPNLYIADGLYTPDDFHISVDPVSGAQTFTLKDHLPKPTAQVAPGDIIYRDLNNDGKIDNYDITYDNGFYPSMPEIVYGFGVNVEWKGIFAGVFFQGVGNASVNLMSGAGDFYPFSWYDQRGSVREETGNRWKASDPYNQNVLFPRISTNSMGHNMNNSTWWFRKGDFLRLKNVEIGYEFDKKLINKIMLSNLRIYLQGTNLFVWDSVKYWDPELGSDASSGAKYPLSRTYTLGLEVTF